MTADNQAQQNQDEVSDGSAETKNSSMREFVEENTKGPIDRGPVDFSTARVPDDQNRLITEHNMRK